MNPLLLRQLRKFVPEHASADREWQALLDAVSQAYDEMESDRRFLEHTLETTSEELTEANMRLRRESELRIHHLSEYYLQTLESQQGMILRVAQRDGRFVHLLCRGLLAQRLGWLSTAVENHVAADFMPPALASELETFYSRTWAGENCLHEFVAPGGTLSILARFQLLLPGTPEREIIVSCIDITERKEAEKAILLAKEKAESADRAKSEFLAVMSHEIRTPLNAVLGFTSLLEGSPLNDNQCEWVHTIGSSGRSLMGLLNDVLDIARIEAGKLGMERKPCELFPLLESVHAMLLPKAQEKGLALHLVPVGRMPELVITDPTRLRQIVVNLLSNAIKFTEHGSVSLSVSCLQLPDHNQRLVEIRVADTGEGIPLEMQDRLFKPFSQVDSSATRQHGGTGLGLAISKRLAQALGGDIFLDSARGSGTVFSIRIPMQVEESPVLQDSPVPQGRRAGSRRVLVAEDNPNNRHLISMMLRSQGIEPELVDSGLRAVELAVLNDYDLILMDLRMPGLDGLSATREIRNRLLSQRQPRIVVVTANAYPEERQRCHDAGADSVLFKPFDFADLLRELRLTGA